LPRIVDVQLDFETVDSDDSGDPENDFCQVAVELGDGRFYALNVWTFKFFETTTADYQQLGENLSGTYSLAPDLFVERLDQLTVERAIRDLAKSDALPEQCRMADAELAEVPPT